MTLQLGQVGLRAAWTLQDKILALLAEYGAYLPVYELPEFLDRRFGAPVDEGACRAALDDLVARKRVRRSPDQPAMVRIARKAGPVVVEDQPRNEAEIMPHLGRYLEGDFRAVIEGEAGGCYLVVDTSRRGPATGTWRRPDYTVVNVLDLPLFGRRQVDVHSVELKTEAGCTVPAVFEALSQARETHYAYLAWDLPETSARRADLPEIEAACVLHGIGLITMLRGDGRCVGHLRVRPQRRSSKDLDVHRYLIDRLDEGQIARIIGEASRRG